MFKKFIGKNLPISLLDLYAKIKYNRNASGYGAMDRREVFSLIYKENRWRNAMTVSGPGSTIDAASNVILGLNDLINRLSIESVLDLPCGDFHWMQKVNLDQVQYLGADIVSDLIKTNQKQFAKNHLRFTTLDVIADSLPKADLMLSRDCFVHFSYRDIFSAMQNILDSEVDFLLTTTFTQSRLNYDIVTGDWRPVNLERPPFNFPKPLLLILENVNQDHKRSFRGKALALWKIAELRNSLKL